MLFDITPVTTAHHTACGPACLKMLLGYYGRDAELEDLIAECGVSVNGCSAKDVLRVGRARGLADMAAWREDAAALLRQDRPAIIHWKHNHFVVFCGTNGRGEPVIANPGRGMYPIDVGSFAAMFTGVALANGAPADLPPEDFFSESEPEPNYFDE